MRRWLSSVAQRLAASQHRVIGLLGRSLTEQVAQLLLDEAMDKQVLLPQRTLAAMVGVQRPSLNKVLKEFEPSPLSHSTEIPEGLENSRRAKSPAGS